MMLKQGVVFKDAYKYEESVYIHFGRLAVSVFHNEENFTFKIGKGEVVKWGNDMAIIVTGLRVQ